MYLSITKKTTTHEFFFFFYFNVCFIYRLSCKWAPFGHKSMMWLCRRCLVCLFSFPECRTLMKQPHTHAHTHARCIYTTCVMQIWIDLHSHDVESCQNQCFTWSVVHVTSCSREDACRQTHRSRSPDSVVLPQLYTALSLLSCLWFVLVFFGAPQHHLFSSLSPH